MERNIIDYFPQVLRGYREIKGIADGQQWLFDLLWNATEEVFRNQYIETADEGGIRLFERILNIKPKGSETLEERRFRVLSRWNQAQLPYTYRSLRQYLASVSEGYETRLDANAYALYLHLRLAGYRQRDELLSILRKMIPANIAMTVQTDIPQRVEPPQLTIITGAYTTVSHRHRAVNRILTGRTEVTQRVSRPSLSVATVMCTTVSHNHKGV